ncbi:hypothetical protein AB3S75_024203 [Citrus x aurantiifolia]
MYHTQQLQQLPSFTYLSNHPTIPNPNPSSFFSYPQPAVHHAEPAIYPPGIDPDADSGSHPSTHVGIENQIPTQYCVDPNAVSVAWVTWQAGSLTYENGSLPSTSLNSSGDSYATSQPLVNNVTQSIPTQSKVIQPNQHNPSAATLKRSCNTINKVSLPSQELEMKRQKLLNGGAAVDSVRVCTVCNIACNGQEAFNDHLSGKKHAAQARLVSLGVGQYFAAIKVQNNSFWTRGAKKPKVVQSAWCEVCKINCNSNDVYVKHLQGKKHQKNLENLDKAKNSTSAPASLPAPAATKPIIGPTEKPVANNSSGVDVQKLQKRAATEEDLETKKRKVVESGAVAQAVRVCTICNVVCNSETVFTYHLAGQKHAAMVKKQAGARTETSAPMVSAT